MQKRVGGKIVGVFWIVFPVLTLSCGLVDLSPTPTLDEGHVQTQVAQAVAATVAALPATVRPTAASPLSTDKSIPPTPTRVSTLPPLTATRVPLPTVTSTPVPIPPEYVVGEERIIGRYAVQLWSNDAEDDWSFDNIVTISADGQMLVQLESVTGLGELTGTDITGEGHPDVIIEMYTGGAHCCFSTVVYDLGPALTEVLHTPDSNCGGEFRDLDGDSVLEFITCDDLFAYAYCPYASSPSVQVILRYEPNQGYVPDSPRFADLYDEAIATHTEMAERAVPEELGEWDGTTKCAVLPLVLDYLYSGRADRARMELERLYQYPDQHLFWAEVVHAVTESPLYVSRGSVPTVSRPSYYMLELLTGCGPEWQYVGLLSQGQSACDPQVPHRDIYWLDARLREIGLLGDGEGLEVVPTGCTTDCRLDVVKLSDGTRLGAIRLDTTVGFPGVVYRINGAESEHWRLRGDLAWERVSP